MNEASSVAPTESGNPPGRQASIERALTYLDAHGRPVEAAWARHICAGGPRQAVLDALADHQNDDGGFGRGLEVDITAPDSQPFAARLALLVLISTGASPEEPLVRRLAEWLEREQGEDGCWRFPPGVYEQELAPWFAAWPFPSLNPALCLAGAATRLGIGSGSLHDRGRALADRMASIEEARTGDFYTLLPYVEYVPHVDHPRREAYLAALAGRIEEVATAGDYEDAQHFFEHVGPPEGELARRLPPDLIAAQLDRLLVEQREDGGWPTPYNQGWRSWATASNAIVLHQHGDGAQ